jgi:transglutaminase-like putative cysteine protease
MREEDVMLKAPPRLLLGLGFLFWGAMVEYPFIGLLGAVAFEARNWTPLRWHFGEKGFVRAWQLCIVMLIIAAVRFFSSDEERTAEASLTLLSWLPYIFMPLGLAQQYSADRGVPLTSFSYFARRKINLDRKAGRAVLIRPAQIGFPYLGIILISAGLGLPYLFGYGLGVVVLFGIGLYFMREERSRPIAWGISYVTSLVLALGLSWAIWEVYNKLAATRLHQKQDIESGREVSTALGQVAEIQLSPKIDWRYYQDEGKRPQRLRLAVYNEPRGTQWKARRRLVRWKEKIDSDRDVGGDFESLLFEDDTFFYAAEGKEAAEVHRSRVRGLVSDESLIPIPHNVLRYEDIAAEGIDVNSQGTTRLSDPANSAIEIEMVSGAQNRLASADLDPSIRDLELPVKEIPGLDRFWKKLGVEDLPEWSRDRDGDPRRQPDWSSRRNDRGEQEVLRSMLRAYLLMNFSYSLELDPDEDDPPVTHFLEEMEAGHCEYFASTAAMLLRRAGIPTRYAVGYVVDENGKGKGEWILRGKHAHAWAQAYLGGEWVNEARSVDQALWVESDYVEAWEAAFREDWVTDSPGELGYPGYLKTGGEEVLTRVAFGREWINRGKRPIWRCRGGEWVEVDMTPSTWLDFTGVEGSWGQRLSDWWQISLADLIVWFSGAVVSFLVKLILFGGLFLILARVVIRLWTTRGERGEELRESWAVRARSDNPLAEFESWLAKRFGLRPASIPLSEWLREKAPELIPVYQEVRFDPASKGSTEELQGMAKTARKRLREETD